MRRFICFLSFCVLFSLHAETKVRIYRWVNEDGQIIFSDQPVPGAKPIDLSTNVQNIAKLRQPKPLPVQTQKTEPQKTIPLEFADLENNATVRNAAGELSVTAHLGLYMQLGVTQKLELLLDGTAVGKPQSGMTFSLTNIDRGEHTLQLRLINAQGDILSRSEVITFYMHRPFKHR